MQARVSSDASQQSHTPSSTSSIGTAAPSAQVNERPLIDPLHAEVPGSSDPSSQSQKSSFILHMLVNEGSARTRNKCIIVMAASSWFQYEPTEAKVVRRFEPGARDCSWKMAINLTTFEGRIAA